MKSSEIVITKEVTTRTRLMNGNESHIGATVELSVTNRTAGKALALGHVEEFLQVCRSNGAPADLRVRMEEGRTMSVTFTPEVVDRDEDEPVIDGGAV